MTPKFQITILIVFGFLAASCSQTTYKASTYRQTVTTQLEITTNVPAEVRLLDRTIGTTPVASPFNYEEEVDRQVKTANYWETNPGTAAALTVLSFGHIYRSRLFRRSQPQKLARRGSSSTTRLCFDYQPMVMSHWTTPWS
jgi:hypothetical protein